MRMRCTLLRMTLLRFGARHLRPHILLWCRLIVRLRLIRGLHFARRLHFTRLHVVLFGYVLVRALRSFEALLLLLDDRLPFAFLLHGRLLLRRIARCLLHCLRWPVLRRRVVRGALHRLWRYVMRRLRRLLRLMNLLGRREMRHLRQAGRSGTRSGLRLRGLAVSRESLSRHHPWRRMWLHV